MTARFYNINIELRTKFYKIVAVPTFPTGHVYFRSYLNTFGLCTTAKCKWCVITDTPERVLYDCWKYIEENVELVRGLFELGIRLDIKEVSRNVETMVVFNEPVMRIGRIREEQQIHIDERLPQE